MKSPALEETVNPYSEANPSDTAAALDVPNSGVLIINADDWGRDEKTTDRIYECAIRKAVSSVSAMVFMEDSERSAAMAKKSGIDAGLHINLTTPFSAKRCPAELAERQQEITACLRRYSFARVVYHPILARSFRYVVESQIAEYRRLYGMDPVRFDGHHHMHLCSNVVFGKLLPRGSVVRRNFSFQPGEKSIFNRAYRKFIDSKLAARHELVDFFFSLPPLDPPGRLEKIFALAKAHTVEVETHPVSPDEYRFLMGEEFLRMTADVTVADRYAVSHPKQAGERRLS